MANFVSMKSVAIRKTLGYRVRRYAAAAVLTLGMPGLAACGGNGGADIILNLLQLLLIRLNGFLILGALLGELAHLGLSLIHI